LVILTATLRINTLSALRPRVWQSSAVATGYQRHTLWGIGEEALDAFDELVNLTLSRVRPITGTNVGCSR
jgi:hypothetical protein